MHPYHSVPYTILETFPPTCARYFLFMLSGPGSAAWQSSTDRWYSPGARIPPAECDFTGFNYPWGSHHGDVRVVTSGFTPTLVLCHQRSLLPEAFGPGACFNSCLVCLKTGNLVFWGCFFDAVKGLLDVLGQVASPTCTLGRVASPPVVGLCKTLASGSSGPIARRDAAVGIRLSWWLWSLGQFLRWEMPFWDGKDGNVSFWKRCCNVFQKTHEQI